MSRWTPHEEKLAHQWHFELRMSLRQIAEALGRSHSAVHGKIYRRQGEAPNEPPPPDFTQAEAMWAELLGGQTFESVRTRSSHRYVEQLQGGREL